MTISRSSNPSFPPGCGGKRIYTGISRFPLEAFGSDPQGLGTLDQWVLQFLARHAPSLIAAFAACRESMRSKFTGAGKKSQQRLMLRTAKRVIISGIGSRMKLETCSLMFTWARPAGRGREGSRQMDLKPGWKSLCVSLLRPSLQFLNHPAHGAQRLLHRPSPRGLRRHR